MNTTKLKILNVIGFIFMIVMNTLAVALPLAGKTTGDLSDMYPNLFVPIGFTFAIWSVIYLLITGLIIYQWVGKPENNKVDKLGYLFVLNSLFNGLWIVAWHYEIVWLALLLMMGILGTLILMHRKLDFSYFGDKGIQWLVQVPISVYLGWISVASIANFTIILVDNGWRGGALSEDLWASIMLVVAVLLALTMLARHKDIFFAAVIAWASFGIYSKRMLDTVAVDGKIEHISQVALFVVIIGIVLTIVMGIVKKK